MGIFVVAVILFVAAVVCLLVARLLPNKPPKSKEKAEGWGEFEVVSSAPQKEVEELVLFEVSLSDSGSEEPSSHGEGVAALDTPPVDDGTGSIHQPNGDLVDSLLEPDPSADWAISFEGSDGKDQIPPGSFNGAVESMEEWPPLEAFGQLNALPVVSEKTGEFDVLPDVLTPSGALKKRALRVLHEVGKKRLDTPMPDNPPEVEETSQATVFAVLLTPNGLGDDTSTEPLTSSPVPLRPATPPPATLPSTRSDKPTLPGPGNGSIGRGENCAVSGSTVDRSLKR
ncbi:hypothetical protein COY93_04875 [Candidatus Uhrbacteria bacterium CG_4_10_14_0_8_um_filter_58_22]|uniref:Uncharacterized protein n=1 Tax=Candidatus Uhrbacteria bacterium CG_4_10_14_0_8_um_filter_58_22 TaxID=1975029 RepID=A0A2M7Q8N2_9BACT|nr:MAG: hypothetical protein AUJ19_04535 [Parcubacteria group bacterium CG1_02_58_44]PIY61711.1 MAG: hypothetical protein COY93_04875 [Candidatus Uhrbacteria bacterium CG_4_10_14_0_8_um_filter_58_22]